MENHGESTGSPETPGLIRFITIAYYCIFTAAVALTLFVSMTTTITFRQNEQNDLFDYVPENIPVLLACMLVILALLFVLSRSDTFRIASGYELNGRFRRGRVILPLLAFISVYGLVLIFSIRGLATNDALMLDDVINRFMEGDYSAFTAGYLQFYPFQIGYVAAGQLMYRLFGASNFIAYQLVNLVTIVLTMYILYLMTWELFHSGVAAELMAVLAFGALFFYHYSTFVYSDIWSVFLQTAALYLQIRYLNSGKIRYEVLAGIMITLGYVLKSNCLIALIAMVMTLLFSAWREAAGHGAKAAMTKLGMVLFLVVMTFGLSRGVNQYYAGKAGIEELPRGVTTLSYLAMGMQEAEGKAGWYNGFNASAIADNGFDADAADEVSRQAIRERWAEWMSSKSLMVRFYYEKYRSQWGDPTCVSLREQELTARHVENQPALAKWVVFGTGYRIAGWIMNTYHAVIYLGTVIYCLLTFFKRRFRRGEVSEAEAMIVMFIFGGMAFHMLWEASSRYVIRYYLAMLPLAAYGYYRVFRRR